MTRSGSCQLLYHSVALSCKANWLNNLAMKGSFCCPLQCIPRQDDKFDLIRELKDTVEVKAERASPSLKPAKQYQVCIQISGGTRI